MSAVTSIVISGPGESEESSIADDPSSILTSSDSIHSLMSASVDDSTVDSNFTEDVEEVEFLPPLLHPDPSRMVSCLRAPCLKKQHGQGSGPSSPLLSSTVSPQPVAYTFTGIKTLCASLPKRQVHFDAAPPEAGLTYSGDKYDRRPIECTQGGSQADLSLPPRGKCPSYAGDADDEACEDEDEEDEHSKAHRIGACAKWARLKNGSGILAGMTSNLKSCMTSTKKTAEEDATVRNACSTPVHGIRAFGGLAGQSGLSLAEEKVTVDDEIETHRKETLRVCNMARDANESSKEMVGKDTPIRERTMEVADDDHYDEDFESEERHDAFRKAVFAALSKDPNATPMPSPSVRPRWECVTSYFASDEHDGSKSADHKDKGNDSPAGVDGAGAAGPLDDDKGPKRDLSTGSPLSKEQEASKVATWTKDQASHAESSSSNAFATQSAFTLTLPPSKCSPSASLEACNLTNLSSSPMSSRCSSSDAWGSDSNGERWSGSEHDAFDAAFMVNNDQKTRAQQSMQVLAIPQSSLSLPLQDENTPVPSERKTVLQAVSTATDSDHHDGEHTSSSSSGGNGAGWLSSCCTSPEMSPLDLHHTSIFGATSPTSSFGSASLKMALMQEFVPLELEANPALINGKDTAIKSAEELAGIPQAASMHLSLSNSGISTPQSGFSSPRQIYSGDEEDCSRRSISPLRCPSKKTRKTRRTASGSDVRDEVGSEEGSPHRPNALRSKSMSSSAPGMKRTSSLKKSSVFASDFDDEGALGGF